MRDPKLYLKDILEAIEAIEQFVEGVDFETFKNDDMRVSAVIRKFEIIGEAAKNVPPYYDNVPYSDLSDFFYVWLKRTIGDLYPEFFVTPLTPKSEEIIDSLSLLRGMHKEKAYEVEEIKVKGKEDFEKMITKLFKKCAAL